MNWEGQRFALATSGTIERIGDKPMKINMKNNSLWKNIRTASALAAAIASAAGLAYARKVEPDWVEITFQQLDLPRLDPEFDGYRIVQISDIHMDRWMTRKRLLRIVDMVNQQEPDLIAITGDFVTHSPKRFAAGLVAALKQLRARDGCLAILGNHDHWSDHQVVRQVIQDSGLIDLNNRVHTVRRGKAGLHIGGIDDYMQRHDRLDVVLRQLPENGAAVLLAHEPDYAEVSASTKRFDLQLSGHSHGGQVVIPGYGPLYLPEYARKFPVGLYRLNGMLLYTNRGLGMVHVNFRLNSRPEISVIELCMGKEPARGQDAHSI
jgi:uncharacterized protein